MRRICLFLAGCSDSKSGIHEYNINLLEALLKVNTSTIFDLVLAEWSRDHYAGFDAKNLNKIFLPDFVKPPMLELIWTNLFFLKDKNRQYDLTVFTHMGRIPVFAPSNSVSIVHDLAIMKNENNYGWLRHSYNKYLVPILLKKVDHLVCVSKYTQKELVELVGIPESGSLKTVYSGYKPKKNSSEIDLYKGKSFLFYCARIEHPKKNHYRLCQAYNKLRKKGVYKGRLYFAGKEDAGAEKLLRLIKNLEFRKDIIFLDYQNDENLSSLYKNADAIVIPSLEEGFCFPVLEGLDLNGLVLGADAGAIPEIGGNLITLFDGYSVESICSALESGVVQPEIPKREAIKSWVDQFSWTSTAEKILELKAVTKERVSSSFSYFLGKKSVMMFCLAILCSFLFSLSEAALGLFLGVALQSLSSPEEVLSFKFFDRINFSFFEVLFIVLVISIARFVFSYASLFFVGVGEHTLKARWRKFSFQKMLQNADKNTSSDFSHFSSNVSIMGARSLRFLTMLLSNIFYIVPLFIALFLVSPEITLIVGIFFLSVAFFAKRLSKISYWQNKLDLKPNYRLLRGIQRVTRNSFFIKSVRSEVLEWENAEKEIDASKKYGVKADVCNAATFTVPPVAAIFMMLGILYGVKANYFQLGGSLFFFYMYLLVRAASQTTQLTRHFSETTSQWPYVLEAWKLLTPFDYTKPQKHEKFKTAKTELRAPSVEAQNVGFSFSGSKKLFSNISFSIFPGECLVLRGTSGSGKSTFISLLLGFREPSEGTIVYNGSLRAADFLDQFHSDVAYVGAEPLLFEGSLEENLMYGNFFQQSLDKKDVFSVMKSLGLERFLEGSFLKKIRLNENLENISAGERQRLCLARALFRKPKLLILDEFTANLDAETEKKIIDSLALLKKDLTLVLSTHKFYPLKLADKTLDLSDPKNTVFKKVA